MPIASNNQIRANIPSNVRAMTGTTNAFSANQARKR